MDAGHNRFLVLKPKRYFSVLYHKICIEFLFFYFSVDFLFGLEPFDKGRLSRFYQLTHLGLRNLFINKRIPYPEAARLVFDVRAVISFRAYLYRALLTDGTRTQFYGGGSRADRLCFNRILNLFYHKVYVLLDVCFKLFHREGSRPHPFKFFFPFRSHIHTANHTVFKVIDNHLAGFRWLQIRGLLFLCLLDIPKGYELIDDGRPCCLGAYLEFFCNLFQVFIDDELLR